MVGFFEKKYGLPFMYWNLNAEGKKPLKKKTGLSRVFLVIHMLGPTYEWHFWSVVKVLKILKVSQGLHSRAMSDMKIYLKL